MDLHERFTKEALKAQDGKRVPLTIEPGGPVIGEAVFRYDEATGNLAAGLRIDDDQIASWLTLPDEAIIFKKES
jgi:hypothetical protein